jgi:hypothetical protein
VFKEPCPEFMSYALHKNLTHNLALNLAQKNQLPGKSSVITILPGVIDTPNNREYMKVEDYS